MSVAERPSEHPVQDARHDLPPSVLLLASEFPPFPGGISSYAFELATAAETLGIEMTVVAPDVGADQTAHDAALPFRVVRYRGTCSGNRRTPSAFTAAWRAIKSKPFHVIHAVDPIFCDALALIRPFRRVPFISTIHGSEVLGARNTLEGRVSTALGAFRNPYKILTNSNYTRDLLEQRFPDVPHEKMRVTHLGVSSSWFVDDETPPDLSRLGLPEDKHCVLTAARITPRKGQHLVIEGLGQLPPDVKSSFYYVITGIVKDQEYENTLRQTAEQADVQVIFTGRVTRDELKALYDRAWVFCMPGAPNASFVEGFGLVFLEAAARGLPSIAGSIGGIPEAISEGESGVLLPELNGAAVADAVLRLWRDPLLHSALRRHARPWAERFSWEAVACKSYESLNEEKSAQFLNIKHVNRAGRL